MTEEQLCRISHYLYIVDAYFFREPGRADQRQEVAQLQHAISDALANMPSDDKKPK